MGYLETVKPFFNYVSKWCADFDARHATSMVKIADSVIQIRKRFRFNDEDDYKKTLDDFKTISMFSGAYSIISDTIDLFPTWAFIEEFSERFSRGTIWKDLKHGTTVEKVLLVSLPIIKIGVDALNMTNFFQHIGMKDEFKIRNFTISKDETSLGNWSISNNTIRSIAYGSMAAISIYTTKGKLKTAASISTIASSMLGMTNYSDKAVYFRFAASVIGYADTLMKI